MIPPMPHLLLLACVAPTGITVGSGPAPDTDTTPADTDTDTIVEAVPDSDHVPQDADAIFREDVVHEIAITLSDAAWNALLAAPRDEVEAELAYEGESWTVTVSLKGNTSFDALTGKPAFKVDANGVVEGQQFYGMPSFYLQNGYWDPSAMHEFLGYGFFQDREVPTARAAFAHLTVNTIDYGLYTFLEKEHGPFLERYLGDASGSVYESGSFNWPCDLSSGPDDAPCECFEVDRVGTGDTFADLQALCTTARDLGTGWYEGLQTKLDAELFLRGQAAEMVVSHYDNYGWNINNWRIAHDPTADVWIWTPWSVDLAFGWYPWMTGPHCGTYGVTPDEYRSGYLVDRCWRDTACKADLVAALDEAADAWDAADMPARIDAAEALIRPYVEADDKRYYSVGEFDAEVSCMRAFSESRADAIREWAAAQ